MVWPVIERRQAAVLAARRMIERSMDRFGLYPARLMGDSAHGAAEMRGWLVYDHGIEPHVTVFDRSTRKDRTSNRHETMPDEKPATPRRSRNALDLLPD